jgi:hypothetical protein
MPASPLTEREILERIIAASERTSSNTTIVALAILISFILGCLWGLYWTLDFLVRSQ